MLPLLTKYLTENWGDFFPQQAKAASIDYLGILGSHEGGKISFLAFVDKQKKPTFIIKILRDPNRNKRFFNEQDALIYLNSLNSSWQNSIPKLILCKKINHTWCLIESILEGKGMNVHLAKNSLPNLHETKIHFYLAKKWLFKLNIKSQKEVLISTDFIESHIFQLIKKAQEKFFLKASEIKYLKKISASIEKRLGEKIKLFFRHGDFCRQNILINKSKIGVIDWEFSQPNSLPVYDLIFFLITYYHQAAEKGGIQGITNCFKKTFFEKNDYSNLVRQLIINYCKELNIRTNLVKLFFTTLILERAIFEYQNLVEMSEKGFIPFFEKQDKDNQTYLCKIKNQLWINLFRFLVKNETNFIL